MAPVVISANPSDKSLSELWILKSGSTVTVKTTLPTTGFTADTLQWIEVAVFSWKLGRVRLGCEGGTLNTNQCEMSVLNGY